MNISKKLFTLCLTTLCSITLIPTTAFAQCVQEETIWRYEETAGPVINSWRKIDNTWYHFNESDVMDVGWITDNSKTYYLDSSGAMLSGTQILDNNYYSFLPTGELLGGPVAVHIEGLDDYLLKEGIRQTDLYWTEINKILTLVNMERTKHGSTPLTLDKDLCNIAGYRCAFMDSTGCYEHYLDGVDLSNTAATAYYKKNMDVGENLYSHYSTDDNPLNFSVDQSAERGFNHLMQSPGHFSNMMESNYKKIGIGIYTNPTNTRRYLTQIFF